MIPGVAVSMSDTRISVSHILVSGDLVFNILYDSLVNLLYSDQPCDS